MKIVAAFRGTRRAVESVQRTGLWSIVRRADRFWVRQQRRTEVRSALRSVRPTFGPPYVRSALRTVNRGPIQRTMRGTGRPSTRAVFVGVFYVSGFCALLYQILWQCILTLFGGADLESVTIVVAAFMLGWRALQLLIDLPFPLLHPLVPLACALAALWVIARDPLAIETFAPELQKRGI